MIALLAAGSLPAAHAQGPTPPGDLVLPLAFAKITPTNNTTVPAGSQVTLVWETSTNAKNYYFCIDATNDSHCDGTWFWSDNTDYSINITGEDLLPGTTYYWQAMACTSGDPKPSGCIEANGGVWWALKVSPYVVYSIGSQDGWILEKTETSGIGSSLNATSTSFRLGDYTADRQFVSILSFDTSTLPDSAYVTSAVLKIRKSSLVGSNPFLSLGILRTAIRKPYFGSSSSLALEDFNAAASANSVGNFTPVTTILYSATLTSTGRAYINKAGLTQFRLYFSTDDNDNGIADYMEFYSGNTTTTLYKPQLIISYIIPVSH
jgi:hypothetical protein